MQCTRRFEIDAGHRVMGHGGKCRHAHGHRFRIDVTLEAEQLDGLGMVLDFGAIKQLIGTWLDENLDHGFIVHQDDAEMLDALSRIAGQKIYRMPANPTAENIASHLMLRFVSLMAHAALPQRVTVAAVRVYETPNCWSDA